MIMPGPYRGSAVPTRVVCVAYRSTATQTVELLAPEPRCGVYVLTSSVYSSDAHDFVGSFSTRDHDAFFWSCVLS